MHPINRLLAIAGLNIVRVPTTRARDSSDATSVEVLIGGRSLIAPADSELPPLYKKYPTYMAELARIASQVFAKYPEMVAVDVGANIGDTSSIIRSGCSAPIICFEGDRNLDAFLAENASRVGNMTIRHTYLSDRSEMRDMMVDKLGNNSTLLPLNASTSTSVRQIEFLTLDDAIPAVAERPIKLLKVDTEGFDPKVLRGASRILSDDRPVVLFEHNRANLSVIGEDNVSAFVHLRNAGYGPTIIWDAFGRMILGSDLSHTEIIEDLHGYVGFNGRLLSAAVYLDACLFHRQDEDVARSCVTRERQVRDTQS